MTVTVNQVQCKLEEILSQLEKSWPKTFEGILAKNPFPDAQHYFIYTFTKWNYQGEKPTFVVWHQPRRTCPDPFWGTTCRKVFPATGKAEIAWTLPHKEGQRNYAPGKMFHDPFVWDCILNKKNGGLEKLMNEENGVV